MDRAVLRERIAQHPRAVTFAELRRMLEAYGWQVKRVNGSHHVFEQGDGRVLVIPRHLPHVKPPYVKLALRATEADDD